MTVKQLLDLYLNVPDQRVSAGELSLRRFGGYKQIAQLVAKRIGRDTLIADLVPYDFQRLKACLVDLVTVRHCNPPDKIRARV